MRIVGVLLAAGSGSRFGGDKLLHPIPDFPHPGPSPTSSARDGSVGRPLPRAGESGGEGAAVETASHASGMRAVPLGVIACRNLVDALPDTLAIVRPGDAMLTAMLREAGARVLPCPDAALGMGHTLACAIAASRDADGWVVALADMPWLRISTIRSIADSLRAGAAIVAPAHRGKRGNPVGFSSRYAEALASLEGDRGARGILALAGAALQTIELDDDGVLRDVDARGDL